MATLNFCPKCGNKISPNTKFCPNCGGHLNTNGFNESKREKVLKGNKKSNKNGLFFGVVSILFVGALIYYLNAKPSKEAAIIEDQPKVIESVTYPAARYDHAYSVALANDGKIVLPLDVVKERKFVKFDYIGANTTIPLLAYLTEDGKVVTAISLCEPCDSKDFHIQGSDLICNSCGTTWNLNNLDAISGSCGKYPPDPIPSKVVGNEIQIDANLVLGWTRRV